MTRKYKEEIEIEALELAKLRRMESTQGQEVEISLRETSSFVRITRRITDSEKRLISFITKSLGLQIFFQIFADSFIR